MFVCALEWGLALLRFHRAALEPSRHHETLEEPLTCQNEQRCDG